MDYSFCYVDDMRQTLQSMDFYKKTDDRIVFAAIHDAVLTIQSQLDQGQFKFSFICKSKEFLCFRFTCIDIFLIYFEMTNDC